MFVSSCASAAWLLCLLSLMPSAHDLVNRAANRAWTPPPTLSLADWADENRTLGGDSPEPGKYRTARTPYVRGIADCLSPSHPARHIAWEKASQIAATTLGINWIGYIIDQCPASTIITLPSEGVAKEWSAQRLAQLVDETPCLVKKVLDSTRRGSGSSIYLKRVAGTSVTIKIAWSSSAKKLASTPAAYLLSDEVDRFEGDVEGEGDPLWLLDRRFTNYPHGKHFKVSTPTGFQNGTHSRIEREFQRGDQRYYFVPCPYCGHFQRLDFHRLRWPARPVSETSQQAQARYGQVAYYCIGCDQAIPERFKTQILARGMWVATVARPELVSRGFAADQVRELAPILAEMERAIFASFHLSALYSPLGWYSWSTMAEDWELAQGDVKLLKIFVNTVLGEVFAERGEAPAAAAIYGKREFYEQGVVPRGGLFLTLTADVQADRIEYEVKAWGRNRESWSVEAAVLNGDTSLQPVWDALEDRIRRDWRHVDGAAMPIWAAAIDTGYRPQRGYDFCGKFPQPAYGPAGAALAAIRTVVPIKGGHAWDRAIEGFSSVEGARKRDGLRIITVGSSYCKQEVYNAIRLPMPVRAEGDAGPLVYPAGYWHYPDYQFFWFQGLTAESRVVRAGKPEWVKDAAVRNEPLDLGGYHVALCELCGAPRFKESDWVELERRVLPPTSGGVVAGIASEQPRRVLKSSWLER